MSEAVEKPALEQEPKQTVTTRRKQRLRLSLREYFGLITIAALAVGLWLTSSRLSTLQDELKGIRAQYGYLAESLPDQIAASRSPADAPLTYHIRVRVPSLGYRVTYSSIWPKDSLAPNWFGAVPVPTGESLVTIRIMEDPRDHRWKIATMVGSPSGTNRMATVLPDDHASVFRGSHQVISTGVSRETLAVNASKSIRILDERWLVGEGGLLLYGDRAPNRDQIGIYAELQPDVGPL